MVGTSRTNMEANFGAFTTNMVVAPGWGQDSNATMDAKLHRNVATYAQTVACVVTFSNNVYFSNYFPETHASAPSGNYHVANKKYVDDTVSGLMSIPLYTNTRTYNYSWGDVDQYLIENTASTGTFYCFIYPPLRGSCTKVEVDAYMEGQTGGSTCYHGYLDVRLQYITDGGTWTDCTNGSTSTSLYFCATLATGDRHVEINSPTLAADYEKQYRVQIMKYAVKASGASAVSIFNQQIYSCVLTV